MPARRLRGPRVPGGQGANGARSSTRRCRRGSPSRSPSAASSGTGSRAGPTSVPTSTRSRSTSRAASSRSATAATGPGLPDGANVRATYTSVHPGYVDMVKAMKRVDPHISVCSEWARTEFIKYMGQRRYDCLAAHPYKMLASVFDSRLDLHDWMMVSEREATSLLGKLRDALRRHGHRSTGVGVTEFGAISLPAQPHAPQMGLRPVGRAVQGIPAGPHGPQGGALGCRWSPDLALPSLDARHKTALHVLGLGGHPARARTGRAQRRPGGGHLGDQPPPRGGQARLPGALGSGRPAR